MPTLSNSAFCAGGFSMVSASFFLLASALVALGLVLYNQADSVTIDRGAYREVEKYLPKAHRSLELESLRSPS